MPPTSIPPESDLVMENVFKKFEKFLIQHGFLVQNTIKNLSIPQIKTVFHLHFKHEVIKCCYHNFTILKKYIFLKD